MENLSLTSVLLSQNLHVNEIHMYMCTHLWKFKAASHYHWRTTSIIILPPKLLYILIVNSLQNYIKQDMCQVFESLVFLFVLEM